MTDTCERPLITFVILAYNQEKFVREAIEGAFAQTWQPLEIILSDDHSSDRTFAIMKEMAEAYDGPHTVRLNRNNPNLGLVPHIDRMMEIASGEFFVVNAGDDISRPERTEKLASLWLASGRRAKLVHSATRRIGVDGRHLDFLRPPSWVVNTPTPASIICDRGAVIGATAAWDTELFHIFGPLGGELSTEDTILPFRAAISGEIQYVDEDLVYWRVGGISTKMSQDSGRNYLYDRGHRGRKWAAEIDRHILAQFSEISYPDKARIEATCRDRAPQFELAVDLADATYGQRLTMGPRAFRLAMRHRNLGPIKDWLRYLFDRLYITYADWRVRRKLIRSTQDMAPDVLRK